MPQRQAANQRDEEVKSIGSLNLALRARHSDTVHERVSLTAKDELADLAGGNTGRHHQLLGVIKAAERAGRPR